MRAVKQALKKSQKLLTSNGNAARVSLACAVPMSTMAAYRAMCEEVVSVPVEQVKKLEQHIADTEDASKGVLQSLTDAATKMVLDTLRLFRKAVGILKRILFTSSVAVPAALVSPIMLALGRYDELWAYYIWCIELLGPSYIKLAQWASTRPDLFPEDLTVRLERLQDATSKRPWSTAETSLRREFGEDWESYLTLDKVPIGSGCIAQVYKGKFRRDPSTPAGTGEIDVAVKLIHPDIEESLDQDMDILKAFTWLVEQIPQLRYLSLSGCEEQFTKSMRDQLDLTKEAAHMQRFANDFKANPQVAFAEPLAGFTKPHALVETLMTGEPIVNFMSKATDIATKLKICEVCCDMLLQMVFTHNFVQLSFNSAFSLHDFCPDSADSCCCRCFSSSSAVWYFDAIHMKTSVAKTEKYTLNLWILKACRLNEMTVPM